MAKYIVQQYIAAAGGETALNSIDSMYAMGKVRMVASEFTAGEVCKNSKAMKVKGVRHGGGEMGGFVLWQKRPDFWCLELVVSGCKISAGSDGVVAWRQTPWHHSHASRGPPRPLRRTLQVPFPLSPFSLIIITSSEGEDTVESLFLNLLNYSLLFGHNGIFQGHDRLLNIHTKFLSMTPKIPPPFAKSPRSFFSFTSLLAPFIKNSIIKTINE